MLAIMSHVNAYRFGNDDKVFISALEVDKRELCACFFSHDLYFVYTKAETRAYDFAMVTVVSV